MLPRLGRVFSGRAKSPSPPPARGSSTAPPLIPPVPPQPIDPSSPMPSLMPSLGTGRSIARTTDSRTLSHTIARPPASDLHRQLRNSQQPTTTWLGQSRLHHRRISTQPTLAGQEEPIPAEQAEPTLAEQAEKRSSEGLQGWKSTYHSIDELTSLPEKIVHPGAERYIGSEIKGRPKWLWDRDASKTVLAEDHMFVAGYVAISYTWGRWRHGWHREPGTPWDVPSVEKCKFSMTQLKDILRRVPDVRYFWIDVLCINQGEKSLEKAEEIAKQGAIFKNANGVFVYLWSIDDGTQLAAAIHELSEIVRWYWQIVVSQDDQAPTKHNGRQACDDSFGQDLRSDPWFSSLWTLQEMILAPASVWISRDGSFCRVDDAVLTTHKIADKFQDFPIREAAHDPLGSVSLNPSRNYVQSRIPESENKTRIKLLKWLDWASKTTSIMTCLVDSRSYVLLAASQRKYNKRRELAVLAALKVGNDAAYDKKSAAVDGISIDLVNDLIQAEGGRLFDCSHTTGGPLTNMLPTSADSPSLFSGICALCDNWELKENGELFIARGSAINQFSEHRDTEYRYSDKTTFGGVPQENVKKHLLRKKIKVQHVIFINLGHELPLKMTEGGRFTAVRGAILVTTSKDIHSETCRWYKAGMYFSKQFRTERLEHDIIVGA